MNTFNEQHAVETFKSLISISTEAFKALQLLNGGAVVAILAFLGQVASSNPLMLKRAVVPLAFFLFGLVFSTLVYLTAYVTQLRLHNENIGNTKIGSSSHEFWLKTSFGLGLAGVLSFAGGAISSLFALGM